MRVLRHAYLNSYFQTGYKNLMDLAIIRKTEQEEAADPRLTDLVGITMSRWTKSPLTSPAGA